MRKRERERGVEREKGIGKWEKREKGGGGMKE